MEKNPLNNIVKSLSKDEVRFFNCSGKEQIIKIVGCSTFNFLENKQNYQTNDAKSS